MFEYDVVIGLEIHAELKTNSKIFCTCANVFGQEPNTNCCPVCTGYPGSLPVINKKAVELTIKAGIAMDCKINDIAIFERKNYFYPDLSKAYQISQLIKPICIQGGIMLSSGKFIRLNRIHLEEDAGKLIHEGKYTLIDYNRAGVPLIEIVSEPDISSVDETLEYIEKLRTNLIYANIADCKMEQGGMRCDVNISLKPKGSKVLGTKTEMKNLNSFKMISRAISYEISRQVDILNKGEKVKQQTLKWDDVAGKSYSMRDKENSNDYRYFPDPDILAIEINNSDIERIKSELPLMPEKIKAMLENEYKLSSYDVDVICRDKNVSSFLIDCVKLYNNPKIVANWIMSEVLREMKNNKNNEILLSPQQLSDILKMLEKNEISRQNAKELFLNLWGTQENAVEVSKKLNFLNQTDNQEISNIILTVLNENLKATNEYKSNKDEKIINYLIGQVMKATKGKINAAMAKDEIIKILKNK